jgi:CheY-like chemotaxis protein
VKDLNGYVDVQSTEGQGTTFALYFPITRKALSTDKDAVPKNTYQASGETLLVVDDMESQREIARMILSELGYAVSAVSSGEEAVQYVQNHKVDLVLLDMIMEPGLDGLETYERLLQVNPQQKAIISSGYSETERVHEAQRLGAGAYLKKPYTFENLGMAVRKELDR